MSLHNTKSSALLAWVNSLKLGDAIGSLSQLQDCSIFLKIISKIHGTEEEQAVLQRSVPERVAHVVGFLEKLSKHKSTAQRLVSEEKLVAAEELELAKVVMLLLYYASMSDKIPREWTTLEYDLQAEMANFLNFMLLNEDCLREDLENFLQKKMPLSSSTSSASSEDSTPPKQGAPFLKLHKIASSSGVNKLLPSSSTSPVGEIMQTPQFQMRRLKKLLEAERENRDELERELAENRKLINEKDTRILMMKQRIDRLTLLHERQAADQLEPKEMEELREKNESLLMRLHETLKQCQDLKTEKGQMDRKISQLSDENGDLAFRLREFARTLTEMQEALNEMCEEHDKALKEWEGQRSRLEAELHRALGEKRCLEEKEEILRGKISLLEDQLAKLSEAASLPVQGEIMADVLKLEGLNQQVASLSSKQAELQATILHLEEGKGLLEASLQSERRSFEAEKVQLTGLLTELRSSSSEASRAKEKLEQDRRAQEERLAAQASALTAEIAKLTGFLRQRDEEMLALHQQAEAERAQKSQLAEDLQKKEQASRAATEELSRQVDQLSSSLRQSREKVSQVEAAGQEEYNRVAQEKELVVRQLQEKDGELSSLAERLRALEQARSSSALEAQQEKAEMSQQIQALEARVVALTAQGEAHVAALPALKSQLREAQQKLAEKEKLAKENARLQERLMVLEESARNTEGILEDEKRRAAESLEGNLRQIAELEEQVRGLSKHKDQALRGMAEEKAGREALEGQMRQLEEESRSKLEALQHQLTELTKCGGLEPAPKGLLGVGQEQSGPKLQADPKKVAELESQLRSLHAQQQEALAALQAKLSRAVSQVKEKTSSEEKLRAEVAALREEKAAARQEAAKRAAQAKKDGHEASQALEVATRSLAEEKLKRDELEARVKRLGEQSSQELTSAESSLSGLRSALKEKEGEAEQSSAQVKLLKAKLEEAVKQQKGQLARHEEDAKRLAAEQARAEAELAAEKAQRAALEGQLQTATNEHRGEVSALQEEVGRAQELLAEKERELEELRLKNVSRCEELRDLQKTVGKLKGELASVEALKEREAKMQSELRGFLEVARTREAEMESMKALLLSKDLSLRSLEAQKQRWDEEGASSRELREKQLKEAEALHGQLAKLGKQCKEQQSAIAKLEKAAAACKEQQHAEAEGLRREAGQQRQRASELERLLEASKGGAEKLRRELLEAREELSTLRSSAAQEKDRSEEGWKGQLSRCRQEAERKASLIGSLEQDRSLLRRQLLEKEAEGKDLRRLAMTESEKSKKLEERLRLLQSEMATAAARAAERCSAMKAEAQGAQELAEKLRLSADSLRKELGPLRKREEELGKELASWQEKAAQKEQLLAGRQQELASAQALVAELMPLKRLCQQLQAEQASREGKHREELEQLRAEASRARLELSSVRERSLAQEHRLQQLQAENAGYAERLAALQQAHGQLAEEKRELAESASRGRQCLDRELAQARQKHALEMEAARLESEKLLAGSKREAEEARKQLEAVAKTGEDAKRQLAAQAEKLEAHQREQAKQVDELKQRLAQQEKAGQAHQQKAKAREEELRSEVKQLKEERADLQAQLEEKEQAAEHYKAQTEKAKTHYDAKKQQNRDLLEKLRGLEKENVELKAESERLATELQRTALQASESELSLKTLSSQVRVLQAQLDFADRQLREQGKVKAALEKGRETFRQSSADISTDSLDLSTSDEGQPLNSTSRKTRRSLSESGAASSSSSKASQRLPHKVESLESLYFTPIPTRARSKLENSISSLGDPGLDSGRKALSGRRRTTQLINITMVKKHPGPEAPDRANESFVSMRSLGSGDSSLSQESVKTRLRSAATSSSARSLASLPSQESLSRLNASPSDGMAGNAALKSLPGYRPATRSSLRLSQAGGTNAGRSSFYAGSCDDEPEQLEGWNRIAELQQRNRVCPPHLKTCYPLESRPPQLLTAITDEEVKTGDPKETLRRASILPPQVAEGPSTRRSTLAATWATGGVATRQQRKRLSEEPQTGPGTPEPKKSASCFPRPQTPKGRTEDRKHGAPLVGGKKSRAQPADKQSERRQSMAFSILNTPRKLGNSLLRRGANRKVTPKASPRAGSRRSPRAAASSKDKASSKSPKQKKVKF